MSVTINLRGERFAVLDLAWRDESGNKTDLFKGFDIIDYKYYTPWPDYTLAEMVAKGLGGKITAATDPPEYVEGRVY